MSQVQTQQQATEKETGPSELTFFPSLLDVGDLEPKVTHPQLLSIFSQVAPVVSFRVCDDRITQRDRGYGVDICVGYNTVQEATQTQELLNSTRMNGKAIRVTISHRRPNGRKSGRGNIFIKNLDKSIHCKALFDIFVRFGFIISCKVPTYASGQSKGYGLVQFDLQESAASAIENMDGMLMKGKQLSVDYYVRRSKRYVRGEFSSGFAAVTYWKNIPEYMTEAELANRFGAFGTIRSVAVILHRSSKGKTERCGMVEFRYAHQAVRAVKAMNGRKIDSEEGNVARVQTTFKRVAAQLRVKFEQSELKERTEKYPFNLYLKNLDIAVDEDRIRGLFVEFGDITSCKVLRDEQGQSKRFGFVAFSTEQAANHAISSMSGRMVRGKPLYVARSENEETRAARLQRYGVLATPEAQFASDVAESSMGAGGKVDIPSLDVKVVPGVILKTDVLQPSSISALTSALASAPLKEQRERLGVQLYPLVDKLVQDHVQKVTGILLQLDLAEIMYLIETPEALVAKVYEAMEVIRVAAESAGSAPADQFAELNLN